MIGRTPSHVSLPGGEAWIQGGGVDELQAEPVKGPPVPPLGAPPALP